MASIWTRGILQAVRLWYQALWHPNPGDRDHSHSRPRNTGNVETQQTKARPIYIKASKTDRFIITTDGEASTIAQHAHTTVFTLFIEHWSWPLSEHYGSGDVIKQSCGGLYSTGFCLGYFLVLIERVLRGRNFRFCHVKSKMSTLNVLARLQRKQQSRHGKYYLYGMA